MTDTPFQSKPQTIMWHWSNQITNTGISARDKRWLLERMSHLAKHEPQMVDHFTAALREIIRTSHHWIVRVRALQLLADYADWADVEWTIFLHRRRRFVTKEEHDLMTRLEIVHGGKSA